jgi:stage V sporulation protein S
MAQEHHNYHADDEEEDAGGYTQEHHAGAYAPRNHSGITNHPNDIIRVSAHSAAPAVAGAVAGVIRDMKTAIVQAIGAGAVNQAVKALAIAVGYLKQDNIDIVMVPYFVEVTINDKIRTAIRFDVSVLPIKVQAE